MYKLFIRPILFLFKPETAHQFVSRILRVPGARFILQLMFGFEDKRLEKEVFGLHFKNPVGLAAGFDKDAEMLVPMTACGFGFIEIGTVTPKPQGGNPKPRLFRLMRDEALINRMGFNNDGAELNVKRLKKRPKGIIIGGNIGKNRITPNDQAVSDYISAFNTLYECVDYFAVNVSSPNTPGLRELQDKEPLSRLLTELQKINNTKDPRRPILLKISPDLTDSQLDDIIEIVKSAQLDGIIATNTTITRDDLQTEKSEIEKTGEGGLSGRPLRQRSTDVIRYIQKKSNGTITIIGVGGIHSTGDVVEKLEAGASLVQLYTGFIYEGPGLVKRIKKQLAQLR
jgi:dihydroorotate dehydrogenase